MQALFRVFLLKECHGWDHETALVEYLTQHPGLCDRFGLDTVPNQSTLWRSWHHRFTTDLQILSRQQLERFSSKPRIRRHSRANLNDRAADTVTRVRNRTPITRPC
jgi:hypothetical protein